MHPSAMWWGQQFLNNYSISGKILEVGSCNYNGGLRDVKPENSEWIGVDIEMCRCVKPGGYVYINAPSTGEYHGYPTDSWRFYRDAAFSLEKWSKYCGYAVKTIHASTDIGTQYCDFVAIYLRE